jgi:signal transduction histidine kinase
VTTLDGVTALRTATDRARAAMALAGALGVERVLLLVRDPVLGTLLPAPGMPQTLRGGRSWREFIESCPDHGRRVGCVELPRGTSSRALALLHDTTVVVLVGGTPDDGKLAELERLMPLLASLLAAEQDAMLSRADAAASRDSAKRAEALAMALETARADASVLNAELRDEQHRKDEFLAMLGHELRNPLSPLVTSIAVLRRMPEGSAAPRTIIDVMDRQITQLTRLVDDLLEMSRVNRGKIRLKREVIPVRAILDDALEESRSLIEANRHHVVLQGFETPLSLNGDRARLVQVFGNLLNNAAKYTDAGGTITISLRLAAPNVLVSIQDTGIGIAPEMQPRVFELFAQAPTALGRALGGLGIGLTLVRTLVELHGGKVSVHSAGPGCGSTFCVTLPVVKPVIQSDKAHAEVPRAVSVHGLRILIVDDNRDAADSIAVLLTAMGHQVEIAYDGAAALRSQSTSSVDLVFLDIGLPDLDGYELARRLKPRATPSARFIALTGYGDDDVKRRSHEAGFDRHVVKPLSADVLKSLISECWRE